MNRNCKLQKQIYKKFINLIPRPLLPREKGSKNNLKVVFRRINVYLKSLPPGGGI